MIYKSENRRKDKLYTKYTDLCHNSPLETLCYKSVFSRPGSVVSYLPVSVMICSLFAQSARASDYGWEPWLLGGRVDGTGSREIGINLQGR